jgi:hypothetical protein
MYNVHEKQRKNLIQAQERKINNEKLMVNLETRHLTEEMRATVLKKFQVRQNHQGYFSFIDRHLNKRINDNLREVQLLELRYAKENFELEMLGFEELGSRKIAQENQIADLSLKQMNEMHTEKENLLIQYENAKEEQMKIMFETELAELVKQQHAELKKLKNTQDAVIESKKGAAVNSSTNQSTSASLRPSVMHSRRASLGSAMIDGHHFGSEHKRGEHYKTNTLNDHSGKASVYQALKNLTQKHASQMDALEMELMKDISQSQMDFEIRCNELEEERKNALRVLLDNQERELSELKAVQEKEIMMEESMHDSEMKMLVERRILNSVLETVADGTNYL